MSVATGFRNRSWVSIARLYWVFEGDGQLKAIAAIGDTDRRRHGEAK